MGLVVFGSIFAVIGVLVAIFGSRHETTTVAGPSGRRLRFSNTVIGGIIVALLGLGLLIGGLVETLSK